MPSARHTCRTACQALLIAVCGCVTYAAQPTNPPVAPQEYRQRLLDAERADRANVERRDQGQQVAKQLYARAQETQTLLSHLADRAKSFSEKMDTLLDSDAGKRIARDPIAFRTYEQLQKYPVVSPTEARDRLDSASALVNRLQQLTSGPEVDYVPNQQTQDQVNELYFWAKDRSRLMQTQESALNTTVLQAPQDIDLAKTKTLRLVLEQFRARFYTDLIPSMVEGEEKASPEAKKIVVDASYASVIQWAVAQRQLTEKETQARIDKLMSQFELDLLRQRQESQKALSEAQTKYDDAMALIARLRSQAETDRTVADTDSKLKQDNQLAEAERKKKMALARSTEVQSLLAPFVTPGYWQPGDHMPSYEKRPVSFKSLGKQGALEKTPQGLRQLLLCGINTADKDRPRWGFGKHYDQISSTARDQLRQAQQYLIDLGPVMVELGMLSE